MDRIANRKTKNWWENYVKHNTTFRGVGIPRIRDQLHVWYENERVNDLSLDNQLDLALSFLAEEYAEDKLAGILFLQYYLYDKCDWKVLFPRIEKLFEKGCTYDWNICDWLCVRVLGPMVEENGLSCAEEISKWRHAKNIWQARSSVIAFANLTAEKKYRKMIMESCRVLIEKDERFAKTGVGWILRELSKSDKGLVVSFIDKNNQHFSKESLRNATKYLGKSK